MTPLLTTLSIIALVFVGLAGSLLSGLFWVPFWAYTWFRTTEPPEPTYDASVRAPKSWLLETITLLILFSWAALVVGPQVYERFFT